ncbi:MAG TPA: S41 family peptidase, partial [Gemmatimonadaceae bacterium]|nr:S41 family peptidase [Gemmatimonadaceae bacterium]
MRLLPAVGWVRLLLAVSGALVSPNRTNAQLPTLNEQNTRAVVDTLARLLEQLYVYPDTGRMIGERLRRRQIDGVYATETSLRGFASRLTADMRSINGDSHLYVDLVPFGQSVGADRSTPADLDRAARAANYGFERVERLAGNVGYLRMNGFSSRDGALEAATAALRFLAQTDAVIIDLRNSVGGSAYLVRFLISHFTGPDTVQTVAVFDRSTGTTTAVWTLPTVPGPRRPDVPLYVLTDHITRSAGEGFSFSLQNLRRATIVGERTAGAGHNNAVVPLGNGLQASISFTRVF